ncbi:uncharacterized protein A4U43_C10F6100 [Asparagus officinalis]|uniref:Uncharacterized protein n=1 Tax=Asparagus officinalis TaxID=4686 RepID=A0A5P1E2U5_ASPOF|nr:uncharacterized protein A4U43_C10F6100 [Asparagus officinalis]
MNQKLRRDNEKKFKDQIAADRLEITSLSVKVASLSAQVRRLREELSETRCRSLTIYNNKRPTREVCSPVMELQTCTDTPHTNIEREVPQPDITNIDTKMETPRPTMEPTGEVSSPAMKLQTCTGPPHIDIKKEVPQPDITNINKENEDPLPGEVLPTEDFPLADMTVIDTKMEAPRPAMEPIGEVSSPAMELQTYTGTPCSVADIDIEREVPQPLPAEVPPPETNIFFEDEDVPLIIKMNKRKKDAKGGLESVCIRVQERCRI